jgi:hypothetical protein
MNKDIESIPNNIRSFMMNNLTPVQIDNFREMLSNEYSVSERSLQEDERGLPVPFWRQAVWAKELSKFKAITKEELFPDQLDRETKVNSKKAKAIK